MRQIISVSIFCAVIISYVAASTMDQLQKDFTNVLMNCLKENHVSAADLETMTNKQMPDSTAAKCLFSCAYKNTGVMDADGKLSADGVRKLSEKYFGDDAAKMKESDNFADACLSVNDKEVADGSKGCDRAALIFKCSVEKAPNFDLLS